MKLKSILRKLSFILLGSILFVGAAEGVLRFGLGLGNPVLLASDSDCNYIIRPNQKLFRFFQHTSINSYGMRSDEVAAQRIPHSLRLMFIGDSITYGTSRVGQSKIFTEILHHELPGILHEPVEVLNASANGWAPDNELSYASSRGIFQSDMVFLVLNSGDLSQPRANLDDAGDASPLRPEATAIGELFDRGIKPRLFSTKIRKDAGDSANLQADDIVRSNLADLERFRMLVASQNARFVVIYIPIQLEIATASPHFERILRDWAGLHKVPLMDLTSAITPYSIREISVDGGTHFNAKGHRVLADAMERMWPGVVPPQGHDNGGLQSDQDESKQPGAGGTKRAM